MAEEIQTEHFFRYTDPNKQLFVRLDALERRIKALEDALSVSPTVPGAEEVNPDFRSWVRGEIQAIKMRMARFSQLR